MSGSWSDRLNDLRGLEEDWDGYGGKPTTPEALEATESFLKNTSIIPTSMGGIQLEWHIFGYDIEIYISSRGTISGISVDISEP